MCSVEPLTIYRVGQKLLHIGSPKWAHLEQFFVVSSEDTDFKKKLFNTKIFSIKFVTKKVKLIFGVRWILLKNAQVSPKCFKPVCNNFLPTLYITSVINNKQIKRLIWTDKVCNILYQDACIGIGNFWSPGFKFVHVFCYINIIIFIFLH